EDEIYSSTVPADSLDSNGDSIRVYYNIFYANTVGTKQTRIYFGGTSIYDTTALSLANEYATYDITAVRESSSVVRCSIKGISTNGLVTPYATYTRVTGLT